MLSAKYFYEEKNEKVYFYLTLPSLIFLLNCNNISS